MPTTASLSDDDRTCGFPGERTLTPHPVVSGRLRPSCFVILMSVLSVLLPACSGHSRADRPAETRPSASTTWPSASTGPSSVALTTTQRRVADELVSVFENGTTEPRYDYVEDLHDGRGYTCGKIGFTTSSTEVRDVVEAYVALQPG